MWGQNGGTVFINPGITVTFTNNVAFTSAFAYANMLGNITAPGVTYSLGAFTVTGTRYTALMNAVMQTGGGGANYFPGTIAGSVATGAQYN